MPLVYLISKLHEMISISMSNFTGGSCSMVYVLASTPLSFVLQLKMHHFSSKMHAFSLEKTSPVRVLSIFAVFWSELERRGVDRKLSPSCPLYFVEKVSLVRYSYSR